MLKRQLGTLFLATCLILTAVPVSLGAQSTITVNPTSGANAQIAINDAINTVASGATLSNPGYVLLTAGTYQISAPIVLKSNVVLKGAGDNTIIFATGSVCNSAKEPAYIYGSGVSNVEVSNLQFKSTAKGTGDGGHGDYRNCIQFTSSTNIKIHDCLFQYYLYCDGVRILKSSGVQVYNCRIRSGHDGIQFLSGSSNCRAYNNDIDIRVNTGIRADNSKNIEIDHNTFYGLHRSGWCCTEMESSLSGIKIHHNIFHDYQGSSGSAAVQPVHASGSVSVYENVLWNVGSIKMGTTSNNIINPSDKSVASWVAKGYGYGSIDVTDSTTTDSRDTTDLVSETAQQSPVAAFSVSTSSGKAPLTVKFTDKSKGSPTSYLWNFGDKTTSTVKSPTHKYTKAGKYTITLTVTNEAGKNTLKKTSYITVR